MTTITGSKGDYLTNFTPNLEEKCDVCRKPGDYKIFIDARKRDEIEKTHQLCKDLITPLEELVESQIRLILTKDEELYQKARIRVRKVILEVYVTESESIGKFLKRHNRALIELFETHCRRAVDEERLLFLSQKASENLSNWITKETVYQEFNKHCRYYNLQNPYLKQGEDQKKNS